LQHASRGGSNQTACPQIPAALPSRAADRGEVADKKQPAGTAAVVTPQNLHGVGRRCAAVASARPGRPSPHGGATHPRILYRVEKEMGVQKANETSRWASAFQIPVKVSVWPRPAHVGLHRNLNESDSAQVIRVPHLSPKETSPRAPTSCMARVAAAAFLSSRLEGSLDCLDSWQQSLQPSPRSWVEWGLGMH